MEALLFADDLLNLVGTKAGLEDLAGLSQVAGAALQEDATMVDTGDEQ